MNKVNRVKTIIKRLFAFSVIVLVLILISFIIHVYNVNKYNDDMRTVNGDSVSMEVTCDIHPRGLLTDSWEKNDAFPNTIINGKIYEAVVTNNSLSLMTDWSLRIDIKEDCYINNAWNGKMEIHQMHGDKDSYQLIDLRNYNIDDIRLNYHLAGQDILFSLRNGDYIIYYPDDSVGSGELPIKSSTEYSGEAKIGFILYSLSGDVDLSDYELTYKLNKSYFNDDHGRVFLVIIPLWIGIMVVGLLIAWIIIRFESTVLVQTEVIEDLFALCGNISDGQDYYHKNHSPRVAEYSKAIAERMGMDSQDCMIVYCGALLHNIGNYYMPDKILSKTTELTEDEKKIYINHTVKGSQLLESVKSMPMAAVAAMYHHENYDGTGYPTGKKGDDIPLIARIIAVAVAYDDMNHDRVYRKKYTREEIIKEFKDNAGKKYDPFIVDVLISFINELEG